MLWWPVSTEAKNAWSYSAGTPDDYVCAGCAAKGVRLYRGYGSFHIELHCKGCALKNEELSAPDDPSEHSIGLLVLAVPDEEGIGYWGLTSIPAAGLQWWNALPTVSLQQANVTMEPKQ